MFLPNGKVQINKVLALTRPYIMAYQGTPIMSRYDNDTENYTSSFVLKSEIKLSTVLFVNEDYFYLNNGFEIVVKCGKRDVVVKLDNYQKNYYNIVIGDDCENGEEVIISVNKKD